VTNTGFSVGLIIPRVVSSVSSLLFQARRFDRRRVESPERQQTNQGPTTNCSPYPTWCWANAPKAPSRLVWLPPARLIRNNDSLINCSRSLRHDAQTNCQPTLVTARRRRGGGLLHPSTRSTVGRPCPWRTGPTAPTSLSSEGLFLHARLGDGLDPPKHGETPVQIRCLDLLVVNRHQ
jgi:hypothetical protein